MNLKGLCITKKKKKSCKKRTKPEEPYFLISKIHYKVTVMKQSGTGTESDIEINGENGSKINPHTLGQTIFDKGLKSIHWRKDSLFNKWFQEKIGYSLARMKLD